MKRPLLVTAATATVVVGAFCGFAAHAYASEPAQEHSAVELQPLVVPVGHQPTTFAPSPSKHPQPNGVVVAAAPPAIDLDHPNASVGPNPAAPGRSGDTPADNAGSAGPGKGTSSDDKGGKDDKGDKSGKDDHPPAPPADHPAPPPARPGPPPPSAPAPPAPPVPPAAPGNHGNDDGKGDSSGKDLSHGDTTSGKNLTPGGDSPGSNTSGKGKG